MSNEKRKTDTKVKLTGKLVQFKVQDIMKYQICMYFPGEKYIQEDNLTVLNLLKELSAGRPLLIDGCDNGEFITQQVILVAFMGREEYYTNSDVWKYVHEIDFVPTFAFNDIIPNTYLPNLITDQETYFYFGYVLNQPILDKELMDSIITNLSKNVFSKFNGYVINSHPQYFEIENNITEMYITNNVYVPVEGGLANGKEWSYRKSV